MKLDQKGAAMAEYVWIDGSNGIRSKTKVSSVSLNLWNSPLPAMSTRRIVRVGTCRLRGQIGDDP
jgi:hypothetical protein